MKSGKNKLLPILLALAVMLSMLVLTACSGVGGSIAGNTALSQTSQLVSTGDTVSAVSLAASSDTGAIADDAFSNRDLSGEYDADEATAIDLNSYNGSDVIISEAGTL